MYTLQDFTKDWRRYHPHLNVDAEAAYYYDIYCKIARLSSIGKTDGVYRYWRILKLMGYVESMGHLALDKPYQDIYRLAEDSWKSLTESIEYDTWNEYYQAKDIVEDAIKNAPESALVENLCETIVNVDFAGFINMLKTLVKYNVALFEILPYYQKIEHFNELLPDATKTFVKSVAVLDNILCWRDKEGYTITQRLASRMGALGYVEAHNNLRMLNANHIDAYRITGVKEGGVVSVENIRRTVKGEITLAEPLPANYKDSYIVGVTVQWDKLYMCEPYIWVPKIDFVRVDFENFYNDMLEDIRDEARYGGFVILNEGERVETYAEFYGKGKAKIIGKNMHYNTCHLGI